MTRPRYRVEERSDPALTAVPGEELWAGITALPDEPEDETLADWTGDPLTIALSGFSRCSRLGPRPKRINARESGTVFVCHPWAPW